MAKAALIYAAMSRSEKIELEHLEAAIAWCDFLLASRYYIFRQIGLSPWVKDELDVLDYIRRNGGSLPRRQIQQRFTRLGGEAFERLMRYLVADDLHPERKLRQEQRQGPKGRPINYLALND